MANTFQFKRSSVQGKVPTTSQLALGEIGINTYDGKLFIKKDDGTASIVEIGGSSGSTSAFTGATSSTAGAAGLVPAPSAGDQAKYLQADGTWSVPTDTDTTYSNATTSVSGLMSSTDKSKLNGIQSNAKNFSLLAGTNAASTANGNGSISVNNSVSGGSMTGTVYFNPPDLSAYLRSNATDSASGLITFTHDDGIWIKPGTNGTGAQIRFSDQSSGSYAQYGTIEYLHADGAVTTTGGNSNDGFVIKGTESRTVVKVEGDIIATGTIYDGTARVLTTADEGSGNGIDADTVDGQQGSYYLDYTNFTNTPTIPSSSSFIDTSNTNQTKAGRLTLGSTTNSDEGLSIAHVKSSVGYGSIRGYDGATNTNTIHFFSNSWTSGGTTSGAAGSQGCINLSGSYGVTIGPWNNPHVYVEYNVLGVRGDGASTRGSLKLFRDNNNYAVTLAPSNSLANNYTLTLPTGTGSNGQVLTTDGNGNTSWSTVSSGGISNVVEDTTPQLGGNLDANGKLILFGDSTTGSNNKLLFGAGNDLHIFHNGANSYVLDQGTGGLVLGGSNVSVRDSTGNTRYMQFGSANINIDGDGTNTASLDLKSENNASKVVVRAPTNTNFSTATWYLTLPGSAGSSGQVLTTDGAGNTSWTTVSGGSSGIANVVDDTTPQLGGNLDANGKNIVLGDSAGTTDDRITFGASADLQIYHNGSNSVIQDSGTGDLILASNITYFYDSANATPLAMLGQAQFSVRGDGSLPAKLDLYCENNTHYVRIASPTHANFSNSYTLTLPGSAGSSGQVLTTDGAGNTSWTTVSSGGGSGITAVVDDTTPELGGALDLDGNFLWSNASGLGATYGDVAIQPIATSYGSLHGGLKIHCRDHTSGATHYEYYFNGPNLSTPGSITASGNVTAYSDIKLKREIKSIENALDKVLKISGVTFERTDLETQSRFAGVIAQEVEAVLPEVVSTDENGYKSVAYGNLVSLLIEAVKEQQTQINELKEALNNV